MDNFYDIGGNALSRLATMTPEAIKALFSPNSDETLICLLTMYDPVTNVPILRLADNYLTRISESAEDVVYGVTSRANNYIFLPLQISLPSEEDNTAPKCSIVINDVTRHITPIIRELTAPPKVLLEMVLTSSPDTVEAFFDGFYINNITYNADSVTADLQMINYQVEPFPCYTFTPAFFPGLF